MEDMRADKGAYDTDDVVDSVGKHLEALTSGKQDEPSTPEPDDDQDLDTGDPSTPADDEPAGDDPDGQDDDGDGEPAEDESAIPENVLRSLEHDGWTPEEIVEFHKADPEKAMRTFERIHSSVNELSRQFSQIGRQRMVAERQQQQPQQQVQDTPTDLIDLAALRKDDPDNPLLPVVETLNAGLKKLLPQQQQQSQPQQQQQSQSNQQTDLAVATQVITFLGADHMKAYADHYGPAFDANQMPTFDDSALTAGQAANRNALLEEAEAIWYGAAAHGRDMTVAEALQKAHNLLTEPMRERAIRTELAGKVRKRAKGMTLRSSGKDVPKDEGNGPPKTEAELERRTEARLAKLRSGKSLRSG